MQINSFSLLFCKIGCNLINLGICLSQFLILRFQVLIADFQKLLESCLFLRMHIMYLINELFVLFFRDKGCLFGVKLGLKLCQILLKHADPILQRTLFDLGYLLD